MGKLDYESEGLIEARKRIRNTEINIDELKRVKCEKFDFEENIARIDEHMRLEDIQMNNLDNHCRSLD